MSSTPTEIEDLVQQREDARKNKDFAAADILRKRIEESGYVLIDTATGPQVELVKSEVKEKKPLDYLEIALFGSGETSPSGRKVHEYLIRDLIVPVDIALLETPAGFEVNPLNWYRKVEEMMKVGLQNFQPRIHIIEALRNDGEKSTNNPDIVSALDESDYIHTGAGSPTYAVKHLKNSLAYTKLREAAQNNKPLSFASAATIAFSKYALPVYEIYKVGEDPFWKEGLDFFSQWNLTLTVIPHFNNAEGGADIDTSHAFMGKKRFESLMSILPGPTTVLGIDEQTACVFHMQKKTVTVMGNSTAVVFRNGTQKVYKAGESFGFEDLHL